MGHFVRPFVNLSWSTQIQVPGSRQLNDHARYRWVSTHILPIEAEVRSWLRSHVHSLRPADIDDLVQEAYVRLWASDFARIDNGRSYFYTIIRNVLVDHARRSRIVPMERLGEIEALRIASDDPGPERRATVRQEMERLWSAIATLPKQCRLAFQQRIFENRPRKEIAARMGISERTVEKHLAKALLRVAAEVEAGCEPSPRTPEARRTLRHGK